VGLGRLPRLPPGPVPGLELPLAPGGPGAPGDRPPPSGASAGVGGSWYAAEDLAELAVAYGDMLVLDDAVGWVVQSSSGQRGLLLHHGGAAIFALYLVEKEKVEVLERWRGDDLRVLPVRRVGSERRREWVALADALREEPMEDFPVKGPRTARWRARYQMRTGGPRLHHETWKARKRLTNNDFGVDMHETLSEVVEVMGCFDQGDVSNLAAMEVAYRKLQLIEHFWDEKSLDQAAQNARVPVDEVHAFVGGGRPSSMVCPSLLDYVSRELERISGIKKNARKLREEAAAGKKGQGNAKKGDAQPSG